VDAYTKVEADSKFNERPGTIKFVARATPWDGWLKANGALLSRVDYADLWAEAQDSGLLVSEATWAANNKGCYSTGNGSTTFRIPDLRGRTVIGAEQGGGLTNRQIGSSGGAENHILTIDQMPGHNHATSNGNSTTGNATGYGVTNAGVHTDAMYWNFGNSGYSSMTGGGQSHNNMQPYAALLACIKY
jgi:microcystin-dependent protein